MKTQTELDVLRKRVNKLSKHKNFLSTLAEETKISISMISCFKDWKRWLSVNNYFKIKKTIDTLEVLYKDIEKAQK